MRRLMISATVAVVALFGAACVPVGPAPCSGIWCEVPLVGLLGAQAPSYVSGVTNSGDVLLSSFQPLADPTIVPGARNLYLFHRSSQTFERLGVGGGTANGAISPDGRWVAMHEIIGATTTISLLDLVNHTTRIIDNGQIWDPTSVSRWFAPVVSPDGQYVMWNRNFGVSCRSCVDVVLWNAASNSSAVVTNLVWGYPRSLDQNGAYLGDTFGGSSNYYDIANQTDLPFEPVHAHAAPPISSVDGRLWAEVGSTVSVLDTTTSTSIDLRLPPGWAGGNTPRTLISGDGHHVVASDLTHIWEQDI